MLTGQEKCRSDGMNNVGIGSVPVAIVAKVYGKDPSWVRAGLISGYLSIGFATRNGKRVTDVKEMDSRYGKINYYISPKKLYEETGYMWNEDINQ